MLGCHGGELQTCKSTCFLVDGVLALDAGALTSSLSVEALSRIDNILLSHSHFDHVRDLPMLGDLIVGRRETPLTIWGATQCIRALRENMFNDSLWPDFTKIPSRKKPIVALRSFRAGATIRIADRYTVQTVPVNHPVESCGFVVSDGETSLGMSGDTGPTKRLWKMFGSAKNLRAVLVETSFPNALQAIADVSGHLTPQTLGLELEKFDRNGAEVLLYHLKPAHVPELLRELDGMPVRVLSEGDTFEL